MKLLERIQFLRRAWRYRLQSERNELRYLRGLDLDGATVVDIGANRGLYSYWMHKQVGERGRVVAFEPQPAMCQRLEDLKASFRLDRLTIERVALSSRGGESRLAVGNDRASSGTLEPRSGQGSITVPLMTLDDYFAKHPDRPVRFIKCDIDGHEYECLRGAADVLTEDRPPMVLECGHDEFERVNTYMGGLGYESFYFNRGRLKSTSGVNPADVARWYLNYVFLPK